MFIVKRRSEIVRFGIFLALVGAMGYFVATRVGSWAQAQHPGEPDQGRLVQGASGKGGAAAQRSSGEGSTVNGGTLFGLRPSTSDGSDYFAEFRMNRERSRGALTEKLKEVMASESADADTRRSASVEYLNTSRNASLEEQAEAMVKAKGFADVLVSVHGETAQVVVKAKSLTQDQVMQVIEMVSRIARVKPGQVTVIPRER
jgi:stage III sporulation protein AH